MAHEIARRADDFALGEELLRQARERSGRSSNHGARLQCTVLMASADRASSLGDWPQATLHAEASLRLAREVGILQNEAAAQAMLSICALEEGDRITALARAEQALAIHVRISDRRGEARSLNKIGHLRALAGEWTTAFAALERALSLVETISDERAIRDTLSRLADAHQRRGQPAQALTLVDRILGGSTDGTGHTGEIDVAAVCHRVLAAAGDPRAEAVLVRAHAELQAVVARIDDATVRAQLLYNINFHRTIMEAWSRRIATEPHRTGPQPGSKPCRGT